MSKEHKDSNLTWEEHFNLYGELSKGDVEALITSGIADAAQRIKYLQLRLDETIEDLNSEEYSNKELKADLEDANLEIVELKKEILRLTTPKQEGLC